MTALIEFDIFKQTQLGVGLTGKAGKHSLVGVSSQCASSPYFLCMVSRQ